MTGRPELLAGALSLAAGTYALRLAGPLLRSRLNVSARVVWLVQTAAVVLAAALVATTALFTGHSPAGVARPVGVVVLAAATAAVLWLCGVR
ncbi:AzlD domain-containing protein [Kitasatospora sp. LaBMicrA B282]|uniref:AzlD domain-containing protein n=1 Tax=Kitasatospora sp. LaBMicrA B282 TaxID=3420949 RepID=UPI003D11CD7D